MSRDFEELLLEQIALYEIETRARPTFRRYDFRFEGGGVGTRGVGSFRRNG
jgi:hypothetical protein